MRPPRGPSPMVSSTRLPAKVPPRPGPVPGPGGHRARIWCRFGHSMHQDRVEGGTPGQGTGNAVAFQAASPARHSRAPAPIRKREAAMICSCAAASRARLPARGSSGHGAVHPGDSGRARRRSLATARRRHPVLQRLLSRRPWTRSPTPTQLRQLFLQRHLPHQVFHGRVFDGAASVFAGRVGRWGLLSAAPLVTGVSFCSGEVVSMKVSKLLFSF